MGDIESRLRIRMYTMYLYTLLLYIVLLLLKKPPLRRPFDLAQRRLRGDINCCYKLWTLLSEFAVPHRLVLLQAPHLRVLREQCTLKV